MSGPPEFETTSMQAVDVLRRNGRSFHFAKFFLNKKQAIHAARLYAFCRFVDDLADDSPDPLQAHEDLESLKRLLERSHHDGFFSLDMQNLISETDMEASIAIELIDTVKNDLGPVELESQADLIRYAYGVAGTVGLMMCAILDVRDIRAHRFAIDLGIAMQLTNIARDVVEDAQMNRRYIPGAWLDHLSPTKLELPNSGEHRQIKAAIERILDLADTYYESAFDGFGYLPFRSRFAIFVAANAYRQIGVKLRGREFDVWDGRVVVSTAEKVTVTLKALVAFCVKRRLHQHGRYHNGCLHQALSRTTKKRVSKAP
jgi:phytoene synthase